MRKRVRPTFYITFLLGMLFFMSSCKKETSFYESYASKIENASEIDFIPSKYSTNFIYNKAIEKDERLQYPDSILQIKGGFYGRNVDAFVYSYKKYIKIKHINFSLILREKSLEKENIKLHQVLENIKKLDLTKFENLKAITISGYNRELLEALIEKIAELPKLELLVFDIDPKSISENYKNQENFEWYRIPDNFCDLNIGTLSFTRKQPGILNKYMDMPRFGSYILPDCVKDQLKVSKIVYDQYGDQKMPFESRKRIQFNKGFFNQIISHNKYKDYDDSQRLKVINVLGEYRSKGYNFEKEYYKKRALELNKEKVVFIQQFTNFIQQLLQIQSSEEVILKNAFVDSIPKKIRENKKLKKLSLINSYVSHIPEEIGELSSLETLKIAYNLSDIHFPKEIRGLPNLKDIFLIHTGLSNGFPNLIETANLEQLLYIGKNDVDVMPSFIGNQKKLQTLVWRYSNINVLPDNLNVISPKVVNVDNNALLHLDNVMDMAEKANHFTYDINAIPFEKRKQYNEILYPDGQLLESLEYKRILDELYTKRNIQFSTKDYCYTKLSTKKQNTIINKFSKFSSDRSVSRTDLKKENLFAAIIDGGVYNGMDFKKNETPQYNLFSEDELEELEEYFDIIEKFKLEPSHVFKIKVQYYKRRSYKGNIKYPTEEFPFNSIDTLTTYNPRYVDTDFISMQRSLSGDFDFGKIKHLRATNVNDQKTLNNISKIKGLRYLEFLNIESITKIPECFCELTFLDSVFVRDPERKRFREQYVNIRDEIMGDIIPISEPIDSFIARAKNYAETKEDFDYFLKSHRKKMALRKEMVTFRDRTLFEYDHINIPYCVKKMNFKTVRYSGMINK